MNSACLPPQKCIVPKCLSTSIRTPRKLFFYVPKNAKRRKMWLDAIGIKCTPVSENTHSFVCEDHFDVKNDMKNYFEYKSHGGRKMLKSDVVPHKFHCQLDSNVYRTWQPPTQRNPADRRKRKYVQIEDITVQPHSQSCPDRHNQINKNKFLDKRFTDPDNSVKANVQDFESFFANELQCNKVTTSENNENITHTLTNSFGFKLPSNNEISIIRKDFPQKPMTLDRFKELSAKTSDMQMWECEGEQFSDSSEHSFGDPTCGDKDQDKLNNANDEIIDVDLDDEDDVVISDLKTDEGTLNTCMFKEPNNMKSCESQMNEDVASSSAINSEEQHTTEKNEVFLNNFVMPKNLKVEPDSFEIDVDYDLMDFYLIFSGGNFSSKKKTSKQKEDEFSGLTLFTDDIDQKENFGLDDIKLILNDTQIRKEKLIPYDTKDEKNKGQETHDVEEIETIIIDGVDTQKEELVSKDTKKIETIVIDTVESKTEDFVPTNIKEIETIIIDTMLSKKEDFVPQDIKEIETIIIDPIETLISTDTEEMKNENIKKEEIQEEKMKVTEIKENDVNIQLPTATNNVVTIAKTDLLQQNSINANCEGVGSVELAKSENLTDIRGKNENLVSYKISKSHNLKRKKKRKIKNALNDMKDEITDNKRRFSYSLRKSERLQIKTKDNMTINKRQLILRHSPRLCTRNESSTTDTETEINTPSGEELNMVTRNKQTDTYGTRNSITEMEEDNDALEHTEASETEEEEDDITEPANLYLSEETTISTVISNNIDEKLVENQESQNDELHFKFDDSDTKLLTKFKDAKVCDSDKSTIEIETSKMNLKTQQMITMDSNLSEYKRNEKSENENAEDTISLETLVLEPSNENSTVSEMDESRTQQIESHREENRENELIKDICDETNENAVSNNEDGKEDRFEFIGKLSCVAINNKETNTNENLKVNCEMLQAENIKEVTKLERVKDIALLDVGKPNDQGKEKLSPNKREELIKYRKTSQLTKSVSLSEDISSSNLETTVAESKRNIRNWQGDASRSARSSSVSDDSSNWEQCAKTREKRKRKTKYLVLDENFLYDSEELIRNYDNEEIPSGEKTVEITSGQEDADSPGQSMNVSEDNHKTPDEPLIESKAISEENLRTSNNFVDDATILCNLTDGILNKKRKRKSIYLSLSEESLEVPVRFSQIIKKQENIMKPEGLPNDIYEYSESEVNKCAEHIAKTSKSKINKECKQNIFSLKKVHKHLNESLLDTKPDELRKQTLNTGLLPEDSVSKIERNENTENSMPFLDEYNKIDQRIECIKAALSDLKANKNIHPNNENIAQSSKRLAKLSKYMSDINHKNSLLNRRRYKKHGHKKKHRPSEIRHAKRSAILQRPGTNQPSAKDCQYEIKRDEIGNKIKIRKVEGGSSANIDDFLENIESTATTSQHKRLHVEPSLENLNNEMNSSYKKIKCINEFGAIGRSKLEENSSQTLSMHKDDMQSFGGNENGTTHSVDYLTTSGTSEQSSDDEDIVSSDELKSNIEICEEINSEFQNEIEQCLTLKELPNDVASNINNNICIECPILDKESTQCDAKINVTRNSGEINSHENVKVCDQVELEKLGNEVSSLENSLVSNLTPLTEITISKRNVTEIPVVSEQVVKQPVEIELNQCISKDVDNATGFSLSSTDESSLLSIEEKDQKMEDITVGVCTNISDKVDNLSQTKEAVVKNMNENIILDEDINLNKEISTSGVTDNLSSSKQSKYVIFTKSGEQIELVEENLSENCGTKPSAICIATEAKITPNTIDREELVKPFTLDTTIIMEDGGNEDSIKIKANEETKRENLDSVNKNESLGYSSVDGISNITELNVENESNIESLMQQEQKRNSEEDTNKLNLTGRNIQESLMQQEQKRNSEEDTKLNLTGRNIQESLMQQEQKRNSEEDTNKLNLTGRNIQGIMSIYKRGRVFNVESDKIKINQNRPNVSSKVHIISVDIIRPSVVSKTTNESSYVIESCKFQGSMINSIKDSVPSTIMDVIGTDGTKTHIEAINKDENLNEQEEKRITTENFEEDSYEPAEIKEIINLEEELVSEGGAAEITLEETCKYGDITEIDGNPKSTVGEDILDNEQTNKTATDITSTLNEINESDLVDPNSEHLQHTESESSKNQVIIGKQDLMQLARIAEDISKQTKVHSTGEHIHQVKELETDLLPGDGSKNPTNVQKTANDSLDHEVNTSAIRKTNKDPAAIQKSGPTSDRSAKKVCATVSKSEKDRAAITYIENNITPLPPTKKYRKQKSFTLKYVNNTNMEDLGLNVKVHRKCVRPMKHIPLLGGPKCLRPTKHKPLLSSPSKTEEVVDINMEENKNGNDVAGKSAVSTIKCPNNERITSKRKSRESTFKDEDDDMKILENLMQNIKICENAEQENSDIEANITTTENMTGSEGAQPLTPKRKYRKRKRLTFCKYSYRNKINLNSSTEDLLPSDKIPKKRGRPRKHALLVENTDVSEKPISSIDENQDPIPSDNTAPELGLVKKEVDPNKLNEKGEAIKSEETTQIKKNILNEDEVMPSVKVYKKRGRKPKDKSLREKLNFKEDFLNTEAVEELTEYENNHTNTSSIEQNGKIYKKRGRKPLPDSLRKPKYLFLIEEIINDIKSKENDHVILDDIISYLEIKKSEENSIFLQSRTEKPITIIENLPSNVKIYKKRGRKPKHEKLKMNENLQLNTKIASDIDITNDVKNATEDTHTSDNEEGQTNIETIINTESPVQKLNSSISTTVINQLDASVIEELTNVVSPTIVNQPESSCPSKEYTNKTYEDQPSNVQYTINSESPAQHLNSSVCTTNINQPDSRATYASKEKTDTEIQTAGENSFCTNEITVTTNSNSSISYSKEESYKTQKHKTGPEISEGIAVQMQASEENSFCTSNINITTNSNSSVPYTKEEKFYNIEERNFENELQILKPNESKAAEISATPMRISDVIEAISSTSDNKVVIDIVTSETIINKECVATPKTLEVVKSSPDFSSVDGRLSIKDESLTSFEKIPKQDTYLINNSITEESTVSALKMLNKEHNSYVKKMDEAKQPALNEEIHKDGESFTDTHDKVCKKRGRKPKNVTLIQEIICNLENRRNEHVTQETIVSYLEKFKNELHSTYLEKQHCKIIEEKKKKEAVIKSEHMTDVKIYKKRGRKPKSYWQENNISHIEADTEDLASNVKVFKKRGRKPKHEVMRSEETCNEDNLEHQNVIKQDESYGPIAKIADNIYKETMVEENSIQLPNKKIRKKPGRPRKQIFLEEKETIPPNVKIHKKRGRKPKIKLTNQNEELERDANEKTDTKGTFKLISPGDKINGINGKDISKDEHIDLLEAYISNTMKVKTEEHPSSSEKINSQQHVNTISRTYKQNETIYSKINQDSDVEATTAVLKTFESEKCTLQINDKIEVYEFHENESDFTNKNLSPNITGYKKGKPKQIPLVEDEMEDIDAFIQSILPSLKESKKCDSKPKAKLLINKVLPSNVKVLKKRGRKPKDKCLTNRYIFPAAKILKKLKQIPKIKTLTDTRVHKQVKKRKGNENIVVTNEKKETTLINDIFTDKTYQNEYITSLRKTSIDKAIEINSNSRLSSNGTPSVDTEADNLYNTDNLSGKLYTKHAQKPKLVCSKKNITKVYKKRGRKPKAKSLLSQNILPDVKVLKKRGRKPKIKPSGEVAIHNQEDKIVTAENTVIYDENKILKQPLETASTENISNMNDKGIHNLDKQFTGSSEKTNCEININTVNCEPTLCNKTVSDTHKDVACEDSVSNTTTCLEITEETKIINNIKQDNISEVKVHKKRGRKPKFLCLKENKFTSEVSLKPAVKIYKKRGPKPKHLSLIKKDIVIDSHIENKDSLNISTGSGFSATGKILKKRGPKPKLLIGKTLFNSVNEKQKHDTNPESEELTMKVYKKRGPKPKHLNKSEVLNDNKLDTLDKEEIMQDAENIVSELKVYKKRGPKPKHLSLFKKEIYGSNSSNNEDNLLNTAPAKLYKKRGPKPKHLSSFKTQILDANSEFGTHKGIKKRTPKPKDLTLVEKTTFDGVSNLEEIQNEQELLEPTKAIFPSVITKNNEHHTVKSDIQNYDASVKNKRKAKVAIINTVREVTKINETETENIKKYLYQDNEEDKVADNCNQQKLIQELNACKSVNKGTSETETSLIKDEIKENENIILPNKDELNRETCTESNYDMALQSLMKEKYTAKKIPKHAILNRTENNETTTNVELPNSEQRISRSDRIKTNPKRMLGKNTTMKHTKLNRFRVKLLTKSIAKTKKINPHKHDATTEEVSSGDDKLDKLEKRLREDSQKKSEVFKDHYRLKALRINIPWDVPITHKVERCMSLNPTPTQRQHIKEHGIKLKQGPYMKKEDELIKTNFNEFCELHGIQKDPTPFLSILNGGVLSKEDSIKFVQFLGKGLEDRLLLRIYRRFQKLYNGHSKGRFTSEEDALILEYVQEHGSATDKIFSLANIINRDSDSIRNRWQMLQKKSVPLKRPILSLLQDSSRFLKNLLEVLEVDSLSALKVRAITKQEWLKLSEIMSLSEIHLRKFWESHLYPRISANEDIDINAIMKTVISKIVSSGKTNWTEIDWDEMSKDFDGFNGKALHYNIKRLVNTKVTKEKRNDLPEVLKCLTKVYQEKDKVLKDMKRISKYIDGQVYFA